MSRFREGQSVRYTGPVDRNLGRDGDLGTGEVGPNTPSGLMVNFPLDGIGFYSDDELELVAAPGTQPTGRTQ